MSFLKNVRNGGRYILHGLNSGLHEADQVVHGLGKIVHTGHQVYRGVKHYSQAHVPLGGLAFNLLEHSPIGHEVDGLRKDVEGALRTSHKVLNAGHSLHSTLNRGIENPVLNSFIKS